MAVATKGTTPTPLMADARLVTPDMGNKSAPATANAAGTTNPAVAGRI